MDWPKGGNGRQVSGTLRDRVQEEGQRRSEALAAMKEFVNPLLHAVRVIGDQCGDDAIGINLGIDRSKGDLRFVGEMRVPDIHAGSPSRKVTPYEIRVQTDIVGRPYAVVESCSYSTKPGYTRDRDPVESIGRHVRWERVCAETGPDSLADLIKAMRASAELHAASMERQAELSAPLR